MSDVEIPKPAPDQGDTVFCRILRGDLPCDPVFEDQHCLAFRDLSPAAPEHILIIPRRHISRLSEAAHEQRTLLGHLLWAAGEIARDEGFADGGFRVVINDGERANQTVFHLHLHLLAGRDFRWPPG